MSYMVVASTMNQMAGDWDNNVANIKGSIQGEVNIRFGPELELSSYSMEDGFNELDTTILSWDGLADLLQSVDPNILVDTGMAVLYQSQLYNCRVVLFNRKIVCIRPKTVLAEGENYRENRYFTAWTHDAPAVMCPLPEVITSITGQKSVVMSSNVVIELLPNGGSLPLRVAFEMCQELWTPNPLHPYFFTDRGCHLVLNGSASHWEIRKLQKVESLMKAATIRCGGIYGFSNLLGCDGNRLCFYGRSCFVQDGVVHNMTSRPEKILQSFENSLYHVDVAAIESKRLKGHLRDVNKHHHMEEAVFSYEDGFNPALHSGKIHITVQVPVFTISKPPDYQLVAGRINLTPEEEIDLYVPLWMKDYLVKSGLKGFILPLSGGLDSSSVAFLTYSMISKMHQQMSMEDYFKYADGYLSCYYLSTQFSGDATKSRFERLCRLIRCNSHMVDIQPIVNEVDRTVQEIGTQYSNVTLQNIQARLRMVMTYTQSEGNIVLSSGNVEEGLVGYFTKYDCSSGDINPIGGISKIDLKRYLRYVNNTYFKGEEDFFNNLIEADPTAELTDGDQTDEADLGLTYEAMNLIGSYRRGINGQFGTYMTFVKMWENRFEVSKVRGLEGVDNDPSILREKVLKFFTLFRRNRHKMTTLTPSVHVEDYSPEDNRFDHRQILFPVDTVSEKKIDDYIRKFFNS